MIRSFILALVATLCFCGSGVSLTTRTSATKEGTNAFTGANSFGGTVICTGTCLLTLASTVDTDDGYASHLTLASTPTVPDATNSYTRALRVKLTANPSANDSNLDFTAGYFHARSQSANTRNMCCFNAAMGIAEHLGTGTITAMYGWRGYALNSSTGTVSKGVGGGAICQTTAVGGTVVDCRGLEIHVLAGDSAITTGYGIYIKTPYLLGGSIGTIYGLYMEDQNIGTTKYAIYTNAGKIRFGDTVQIGTSGTPIGAVYSGTASLDYDLSGAGITCQDLTITVTGAVAGDPVTVGISDALASTAGVVFSDPWVSAADTVKLRACDVTSSNPNPAAATVRAQVTHF